MPAAPRCRDDPLALSLLVSLRPSQWTKNLLVFAGLLFGMRLFDRRRGRPTRSRAFVIFCALSGVVYLVNDVADRDSDRQSSAEGAAADRVGRAAGADGARRRRSLLGGGALAGGVRCSAGASRVVAAAYLALQALYSGPLKHIVIIDVLTIAIGFVLRAVAGAVAIDVEISHWLLVCTILLALFIALAKRRHELVLLADGATSHRPILGEYSPYLLDQMIARRHGVDADRVRLLHDQPRDAGRSSARTWLGLTIPFPLYGIFRYSISCTGAKAAAVRPTCC